MPETHINRYFLLHTEDNRFVEVYLHDFVKDNQPKWTNGNKVHAFLPGGDPEHAFWQFDVTLGGSFGNEIAALVQLIREIQGEFLPFSTDNSPVLFKDN